MLSIDSTTADLERALMDLQWSLDAQVCAQELAEFAGFPLFAVDQVIQSADATCWMVEFSRCLGDVPLLSLTPASNPDSYNTTAVVSAVRIGQNPTVLFVEPVAETAILSGTFRLAMDSQSNDTIAVSGPISPFGSANDLKQALNPLNGLTGSIHVTYHGSNRIGASKWSISFLDRVWPVPAMRAVQVRIRAAATTNARVSIRFAS